MLTDHHDQRTDVLVVVARTHPLISEGLAMTTLTATASIMEILPPAFLQAFDSAGLHNAATDVLRGLLHDPQRSPRGLTVPRSSLRVPNRALFEDNGGVCIPFESALLVGTTTPTHFNLLPWSVRARTMASPKTLAGKLHDLGLPAVLESLPAIAATSEDALQGAWMPGWQPYASTALLAFERPSSLADFANNLAVALHHHLHAVGCVSYRILAHQIGARFDHHDAFIPPQHSTIQVSTRTGINSRFEDGIRAMLHTAHSLVTHHLPPSQQVRTQLDTRMGVLTLPLWTLNITERHHQALSAHALLAVHHALPKTLLEAVRAIGAS